MIIFDWIGRVNAELLQQVRKVRRTLESEIEELADLSKWETAKKGKLAVPSG